MARLDLTTEETAAGALVAVSGELDISCGARLEDELRRLEAGPDLRTIVVDLRGLEFMDSTGLRILLAADRRASEAGRRFVLVRGPEVVRRIFAVTRLDERLEIVDEPPELAEAG